MGKNHLTLQTETRRVKSIHRYIGENEMGGGGRGRGFLSVGPEVQTAILDQAELQSTRQ